MKVLGREDILQADDVVIEKVEVPEWGGAVCVRGLTGSERDAFEESIFITSGKSTKVNFKDARAKLLVKAICDESGAPLFSKGDIENLGAKSASALQRVWEKARDLSGLSDEDVDELVGNSESDQSESSTTV